MIASVRMKSPGSWVARLAAAGAHGWRDVTRHDGLGAAKVWVETQADVPVTWEKRSSHWYVAWEKVQ